MLIKTSVTKSRLIWLDALRGYAIFFLIVIHYIGAFESRGLLSAHFVNLIQSIFRVSTPLFIIVFGFTIAYVYYGKLNDKSDLKKCVLWSFKRLPKILLAREVIVLIYSFSHPEHLPSLVYTLIYFEFSLAGEILSFYFLAVLITPFVLYFIFNYGHFWFIPVVCIFYLFSYWIGVNYSLSFSQNPVFRVLFYDVYPFFPFYTCVIFGMYLSILYLNVDSDFKRLIYFSTIGLGMTILGFIFLYKISDSLVHDLSVAQFKSPPHPAYLLFYAGLSILFSTILVLVTSIRNKSGLVFLAFSIVGRNSLLSYTLHYLLHFTVPISYMLSTGSNTLLEVVVFCLIAISSFIYIVFVDAKKTRTQVLSKVQ
ncbi:acyltransferase family protein [Shewanella gaetbuli]